MKSTRSLLALAGFGLATAGAAWYGARYSRSGARSSWYRSLNKPKFTPPDQVFPVVWTTLYALMAWSGYRVWSAAPSRQRNTALRLWMSQLAANAKWSKLFFGEHRPGLALADIIAPQGKYGLIDDPPEFNVGVFKGKAVSIHWESMFTRSSFQTPDMIGQHMLLNDVADLIDKGVLRTTLDQTFGTINAANLRRAHALLESGKSRGKIVLEGW